LILPTSASQVARIRHEPLYPAVLYSSHDSKMDCSSGLPSFYSIKTSSRELFSSSLWQKSQGRFQQTQLGSWVHFWTNH
jgi:hypothetical protein